MSQEQVPTSFFPNEHLERMPIESINCEYKRERPKDSLRYLKTVVAFANGDGGKLIFGVDDKTREVCGISEELISKEMDAITNAIVDGCSPQIRPRLEIQVVGSKTLIICTISPGAQTPYFIASKGIQGGVFIRVGSTTRVANIGEIQELTAYGMSRSPDQLEYPGQRLEPADVTKLCTELTEFAKSTGGANRPPMTPDRLKDLHVISSRDGSIVPSYAYNILAGQHSDDIFMNIRCGVFRGATPHMPIDSIECSGPIYKQIDEAMHFVLRVIRLGYEIRDRAQRYEVYEFPVETIRELIVNAVCHRSYLIPSNVLVALYDDRLSIISPGLLMPGLTVDEIKRGRSIIRNRALAEIFRYLGLMERWGVGIPNAIQSCLDYGLEEPELIISDSAFVINIYRKDPIPPLNLS